MIKWWCIALLLLLCDVCHSGDTTEQQINYAGNDEDDEETGRVVEATSYRPGEVVQRFLEHFYNHKDICGDGTGQRSVSFKNRGPGEGLGSLLNGYLITAMANLLQGKRLCTHESKTLYIDRESCPSQSWDCLFQPVSSSCPCLESQNRPIRKTSPRRCYFGESDRENVREEQIYSNGITFSVYETLSKMSTKFVLPKKNDHWYMSQLYYYFLRPNGEMTKYKNNLVARLFPDWDPKTTISAHVRRGDHWMGEHLDDQAYLRTIRAVATVTKAKTVLLGTDDIEVLQTYPSLLRPLKVIFIPANYSIIGKMEEKCQGRSKACRAAKFLREEKQSSGSDEGKLLMTQIYLMAESLVTVGTIGSNFGRVIHQLQWANKTLSTDGSTLQRSVHPQLHFFDMSGDDYFACGWRKSNHMQRDHHALVHEWVAKYDYYTNTEN